ncbi:peptidoglycan-recognition protein SC2 [Biomphalaria glabrata]|nr:peptidoglycan-recognition protein SC2 [Biomphalaria glabrata]
MTSLIGTSLLSLLITFAQGACPNIISRAEWGARAPKSISYLSHQPVQYAFIHHSAMNDCFDKTSCIAEVKAYQNLHMDVRGWDDVGYSFIIGGDGSVFEGRGWDKVGAHTLGYNEVGLGFCLSGNFMDHLPTTIQMNTTRAMIECGVSLGKISTSYTLRGHRDMKPSTLCPGDKLYAEILTWPHYRNQTASP